MGKNLRILGLIPARGGSKGLPRKNLALLCGKPLITYTIEEAKKAQSLDRIIISTDDEEIAEVSKKLGVEVPFLRPNSLAKDSTSTIDVVIHALNWLLQNESYSPFAVALLQPTSPLRGSSDIDNAVRVFLEKEADSVVSVCEVECSPYWFKIIKDGKIYPFLKSRMSELPRQKQPKFYRPNGAIYIVKKDIVMKERTFYTKNTFAYFMPRENSIDIDTLFDLKFAEVILLEKRKGKT